jgi:hypothetical protein
VRDPSAPPTVIHPNPWQLRTLAKALQSVPSKLEDIEAQQIFSKLIAVIEKTTDPWALGALTVALQAVPGTLAPEKAQQVSAYLFTLRYYYQRNHQSRAASYPGEGSTGSARRTHTRRSSTGVDSSPLCH